MTCSATALCPRWASRALTLTMIAASPASGQLITPRTVPVFQGEQFGIYPASLPGMDVSIALQDTLADPWSNPAKMSRLQYGSIQVMPFTHRGTAGGGRSLPVSILRSGERLSGGALLSLQEVERRDIWWTAPTSERRASNQYVAGVLAWRTGDLSIGARISGADLRGVDGVGTLYAGSDRLRQSGSVFDARLGLTREFPSGGTFELVAVTHRYEMTHDVHFPQRWEWRQCCNDNVVVPERNEVNLDRTRTNGVQAAYITPRSADGWRIGYRVTANRLSHPKIPNYVIQNIPRDPGSTDAFNVGVGAARTLGRTTFGIDAILEPMWSRTWADAAGDTADVNGVLLPQGAHTVDNHFRFANSRIAVGLAQDFAPPNDSAMVFGVQAGVSVNSIRYTLDQADHVQRTSGTQDEAWMEWRTMVAVRARNRHMEVSYAITRTCGPHGCPSGTLTAQNFNSPEGVSVIAAPGSPLNFDGGSAGQHRLMVSIRMR